ncbi:hypothetical protein C8R46DRAFT_1172161, partial [Mycena filopes]
AVPFSHLASTLNSLLLHTRDDSLLSSSAFPSWTLIAFLLGSSVSKARAAKLRNFLLSQNWVAPSFNSN